jgi:ribosomal protein S4
MRGAQQLIVHGKVLVNNKIVRSKYMLNSGDLISIDPKHHLLIEENIVNQTLAYTSKAFSYNKTMQILFGDIRNTTLQ